jgi:hypothetical protein
MNNPVQWWINPVGDGSEVGYSWETTPGGGDAGTGPVYKAAVIPHPLTSGRRNSFPDPYFMHSSG